MKDEDKIKLLIEALNKINKIVFANTVVQGSSEYFEIRNTCITSINKVGGEVK